jgi:excisionase family DNA binding protein
MLKVSHKENDMEPIFCSIADAGKAIGVSRATVYNWIAEGRIEAVRVGGRRLVKIESIRRLAG